MKRLLLCMLMAVIAVLCVQVACAETMRVVNCNEWVSLRSEPDKSSTQLVKIPLGETVEALSYEGNGFRQVEYQGMLGFVLSQYLEVAYNAPFVNTAITYYPQVMDTLAGIHPLPNGSAIDFDGNGVGETVSYHSEDISLLFSVGRATEVVELNDYTGDYWVFYADIDTSDRYVEIFVLGELYDSDYPSARAWAVYRYDGDRLFPLMIEQYDVWGSSSTSILQEGVENLLYINLEIPGDGTISMPTNGYLHNTGELMYAYSCSYTMMLSLEGNTLKQLNRDELYSLQNSPSYDGPSDMQCLKNIKIYSEQNESSATIDIPASSVLRPLKASPSGWVYVQGSNGQMGYIHLVGGVFRPNQGNAEEMYTLTAGGKFIQMEDVSADVSFQHDGNTFISESIENYQDYLKRKLTLIAGKPVTQFNYWDFDNDGIGEAFAQVLEDDPNIAHEYSIWYVNGDGAFKLNDESAPLELDTIIADSGKVMQIITGLFGVEYVYAVVDHEPVLVNIPYDVDYYYLFQNTDNGSIVAMSKDYMLNALDGYTYGRYCHCQNLIMNWNTISFSKLGQPEIIRFDKTGYQDFALTLDILVNCHIHRYFVWDDDNMNMHKYCTLCGQIKPDPVSAAVFSTDDSASYILKELSEKQDSFLFQESAYIYKFFFHIGDISNMINKTSDRVDEIHERSVQYAVQQILQSSSTYDYSGYDDFERNSNYYESMLELGEDTLDAIVNAGENGAISDVLRFNLELIESGISKRTPALISVGINGFADITKQMGIDSFTKKVTGVGGISFIIKNAVDINKYKDWTEQQKEILSIALVDADTTKTIVNEIKTQFGDDPYVEEYCDDLLDNLEEYVEENLIEDINSIDPFRATHVMGILLGNLRDKGEDLATDVVSDTIRTVLYGKAGSLVGLAGKAEGLALEFSWGTNTTIDSMNDIAILYSDIEDFIDVHEKNVLSSNAMSKNASAFAKLYVAQMKIAGLQWAKNVQEFGINIYMQEANKYIDTLLEQCKAIIAGI